MNKSLHKSTIFIPPSASKKEEFKCLKPTDCLQSVWSMFLHKAHGTMISGSSFMTQKYLEFGADSYITKLTKSCKSCNSEAKIVHDVAKRVLMQLQPKIWKETSDLSAHTTSCM